MANTDFEKLFLLEVLVDEVYISNSSLNLDQTTKSNLKETCVTFQFLDYPPLVVCQEDFFKSSANQRTTQLNFKHGKSCLFSIPASKVPTLPNKFDINVSVLRKVEPSGNIVIGNSVINLGDSFAALMHSSVSESDLPLQKSKTGKFDVYDDNNRTIGYINSFLRLSCFGNLIVTQFQVSAIKDTFMFKGTEPKKVAEIPGDSNKIPKLQVDPNYVPRSYEDMMVKQSAPLGYGDIADDMLLSHKQYGTDKRRPQYQQPPQPVEPPGNYKEIVAEIRGHSLHIRVPMKSKKEASQKKTETEGPICKYAPPLNLCDCDFPVPPEAIPRCDPK